MTAIVEGAIFIIAIVGLTPVLAVMVWVYWWSYKFCRDYELRDLEAERRLIEDLGADPTKSIPQGRQISVLLLVGGFLLGAWPFFLLGMAVLGWLGVGLIGLFSFFPLWYFWERTGGFYKRVEALRSQAFAKG